MITGDVGVTTLKLSFIGVCLMGDPVGIGRAHDCPILTVETEHLSNIMDKDEKTETPEVEKIHEKYVMEVLQKSLNIHDIYKSSLPLLDVKFTNFASFRETKSHYKKKIISKIFLIFTLPGNQAVDRQV